MDSKSSDQQLVFDPWQQEVYDHEGDATIRAGRQVGKSVVIGKKVAKLMLKYAGSAHLIIAPAQRQSSQLFIKTIGWLNAEHERRIIRAGGYKFDARHSVTKNIELRRLFEAKHGIYAEPPTKTTIMLKNGSICYALPAGKTGIYLRTFALDFLWVDEAAYVPDAVYLALEPMIAVSKKMKGLGWKTFLSTPFGKGGFFYDSFHDPDFRQWHVSSENCPRIGKEFLTKQRNKLTKIQYAQEWQGEFIDEWNQYFSTALIRKCCTFINWDYKTDYKKGGGYYLGVDIARYGEDENAFVIGELDLKGIRIVKCSTTQRMATTDTIGRIRELDAMYKFRRIFIDSTGVGGGVLDVLIECLGRKVVGIDNATRGIDQELNKDRRRKILKEDLYSTALVLMETGKLHMISNLELIKSLKEMTFEYTKDKNLRIYGKKSHLAEAFVRVCWAVRAKGLNIYIA